MQEGLFLFAIIAGYMTMFMICGMVGFFAVKLKFLKCTAASCIASFFVSGPCCLLLLALFPQNLDDLGSLRLWIAALYMMGSAFIFLFWLKAFEPDSLEILTQKHLRQLELKKIEIQKIELRRLLRNAKKARAIEPITNYTDKLKNLKQAKALIKKEYKVPGLLSRFKSGFRSVAGKSA